MNKPIFYFKRKTTAHKKGVVYIDLSYNGERLQASTGLKITEDEWNYKKNYPKHTTTYYSKYHAHLERVSNLAQDYYSEKIAKTGEIPNPAIFRAYLNEKISNKEQVTTAIDLQADFLARSNEYIASNKARLKPQSIAIYKNAVDELIEFTNAQNIQLTFDAINLSLWDKYHTYLLTKENKNGNCKTKVGYLNDTISKRVTNIKTFMRWALERKYHNNTEFQKIKIKRSSKNEIVTLTQEEIDKLKKLDLTRTPWLEKVRDLFFFSIATCQRWSDIENFNPNDVKDNAWTFRAVKTNKLIVIPFGRPGSFTHTALEVLQKYGGTLPRMCGQAYNRSLKTLGEKAGINEEVLISRNQGNNPLQFRKPKFEFMASHMARRTGITLLLEKGVPPTTIMKITGHSNLATLLQYENTSQDALMKALTAVNF